MEETNEKELRIPFLTTVDNPFNPADDFDNWYRFDEQNGYHTCSLVARFVHTSDELSDEDNRLFTEEGINRILELDPLCIYKKVYAGDKVVPTPIE